MVCIHKISKNVMVKKTHVHPIESNAVTFTTLSKFNSNNLYAGTVNHNVIISPQLWKHAFSS